MIFLKRLVKKKKPLRPTDQNPFQVRSNINTKYMVLCGQQKGMVTVVGQFKMKFQIPLYPLPCLVTTTVGSFKRKSHNSHNVCHRAASTKECNNSLVCSVAATLVHCTTLLKLTVIWNSFFVQDE